MSVAAVGAESDDQARRGRTWVTRARSGGQVELRTTVYNEKQERLAVGSASVTVQTDP